MHVLEAEMIIIQRNEQTTVVDYKLQKKKELTGNESQTP